MRSAYTLLAVVCLTATLASASPVDGLRSKYKAPIYLTYVITGDLHACLNNVERYDRVKKFNGALLLRTFLNANFDTVKKRYVDLLAIDLSAKDGPSAGFKTNMDMNALLTPVGWQPDEAGDVAIFVDMYFNSNGAVFEAIEHADKGSILAATAVLKKYWNDPLLSEVSRAKLIALVGDAAVVDTDGMADLKKSDPSLWKLAVGAHAPATRAAVSAVATNPTGMRKEETAAYAAIAARVTETVKDQQFTPFKDFAPCHGFACGNAKDMKATDNPRGIDAKGPHKNR